MGAYVEGSRAFAVDAHGNKAIFEVTARGGVGDVLEVGLFGAYQRTNAGHVMDLGGRSGSAGFSGGHLFIEGVIEFNIGKNYIGITVGGGVAAGIAPAEFHGIVEFWQPIEYNGLPQFR